MLGYCPRIFIFFFPLNFLRTFPMKKPIFLCIAGLIVVVAVLAGIKALQIKALIEAGKAYKMPAMTVTAETAQSADWERLVRSVGSFSAVQGVRVTATFSGKISKIFFESGASVTKGDLLIQQDISAEEAELRDAQASVKVASLNLERSKTLLKTRAISQSTYDTDEAALKGAQARIDVIRATIDNKTIRAPFSGRLGISQVNLGQNLQPGDPVVTLQTLDPIYIDFTLPQNKLVDVTPGLAIRVRSDVVDDVVMTGVINAINPQADTATRSVQIQAKVANPNKRLLPGMFGDVDIVLSQAESVVFVPQTAVQYAPYGDAIFVIEERDNSLFVRQQIVRLGTQRGDYVAVKEGLKAGEKIVTLGVFKLHNGQEVVIDNTLSPEFSLNPKPAEG